MPAFAPPSGGYVRGTQSSKETGYGSSFTPGKRQRLNVVPLIVNVLLPHVTFCIIAASLSFTLRQTQPVIAWSTVAIGVIGAIIASVMSYRSRNQERDPMWYTFAAITLLVAVILGVTIGDLNYNMHMKAFYDAEGLNSYPQVVPGRDRGQQLMDAGRVYFQAGTTIDLTRGIAFKNTNRYCVAPIVTPGQEQASYDFWAVGVDCCDEHGNFRCGAWNNPFARAGLRLMRDDQRPFFRLAVQQAEAAFNIKAAHPLFFTWMQDPVQAMLEMRGQGFKFFIVAAGAHFVVSVAAVIGAAFCFSKLRAF